MNEPIETPKQPAFRRQGLGYVYERESFRLTLSKIRRSGEGTTGMLYVDGLGEELNGPIVANRFNIESISARSTQAKYLSGKTEGLRINWVDILDRFCLHINKAEMSDGGFDTIGDDEDEEIEWLINNLIIESQPTTIFAPGGSGKSFLALAIGLSLQTGIEFIPGFKPHRTGGVLYMDYEADKKTMNRRARMLCRGKNLTYTPMSYKRCTQSIADQLEDIARIVTSENIQLVIVDSVEMTLASLREGSDPNSAIIALYHALRQIGLSILLIDHVSAAESEKTKGNRRAYGTIFKTNLARLAFELRLGGREGSAFNMGLYNTKANDVPPIKPAGLRVQFVDKSVYYSKQDIVNDDKLVEALSQPEQIQGALKKAPLTVKQISDVTGIKTNQIRTILNEYKDNKFIKIDPDSAKEPRWGRVMF